MKLPLFLLFMIFSSPVWAEEPIENSTMQRVQEKEIQQAKEIQQTKEQLAEKKKALLESLKINAANKYQNESIFKDSRKQKYMDRAKKLNNLTLQALVGDISVSTMNENQLKYLKQEITKRIKEEDELPGFLWGGIKSGKLIEDLKSLQEKVSKELATPRIKEEQEANKRAAERNKLLIDDQPQNDSPTSKKTAQKNVVIQNQALERIKDTATQARQPLKKIELANDKNAQVQASSFISTENTIRQPQNDSQTTKTPSVNVSDYLTDNLFTDLGYNEFGSRKEGLVPANVSDPKALNLEQQLQRLKTLPKTPENSSRTDSLREQLIDHYKELYNQADKEYEEIGAKLQSIGRNETNDVAAKNLKATLGAKIRLLSEEIDSIKSSIADQKEELRITRQSLDTFNNELKEKNLVVQELTTKVQSLKNNPDTDQELINAHDAPLRVIQTEITGLEVKIKLYSKALTTYETTLQELQNNLSISSQEKLEAENQYVTNSKKLNAHKKDSESYAELAKKQSRLHIIKNYLYEKRGLPKI